MLDHIELQTADIQKSATFYEAVLLPLGYTMKVDSGTKGFGDAAGLDFFIVPGEPALDAHLAFRAKSRDTVRACWEAGRLLNALDREPALAPHVHPHYYAGYLRDPDGRLIEFVCHDPE
jgi:catechol 2,3-dioxygenase-like lactoylglutathione lyase family enzyme